jgi:HK97 family phage prohead protease
MTRPDKPRHRSIGNPMETEWRQWSTDGFQVRDGGAKANTIELTGMPIVYNTPYEVNDALGSFTERMLPGVASDLLDVADCRFLINHTGMPLARTAHGSSAGTMTLFDSDEGLRFRASLDASSQAANDLASSIARGDVDQMSVGFCVGRDAWSGQDANGWENDRAISSLSELLDVSAVTYPASPTTSIEIAQRAASPVNFEFRIPDSRIRARKVFFSLTDEQRASWRSGKVLSSANATNLQTGLQALVDAHAQHGQAIDALSALATAAGVDVPKPNGNQVPSGETDDNGGADGTQNSGTGTGPANSLTSGDNSGTRTRWNGPSLLRATQPAPATGAPAGSKYNGSDAASKAAQAAASKAATAAAAAKFEQAAAAHAAAAAHFTQAAAAHSEVPGQQEKDLKAAGAHTAAAAAHNTAAATPAGPAKTAAGTTAKAASKTAAASHTAAKSGWASFDAAKSSKAK